MKVIMIAVVSANGKLTNGNDSDIYKWTSKEDQDFFFSKIKDANLIVMGSKTYETVRTRIKSESHNVSFARRRLAKLRVVMTSRPEQYKDEQISGVLEFSSESPRQLYDRMIDHHSEILLVGGSQVYSSFLKEGLVDEIYLTIEPVLFGQGIPLVSDEDLEAELKLESIEKLNKEGTLLLKYSVKHDSKSRSDS